MCKHSAIYMANMDTDNIFSSCVPKVKTGRKAHLCQQRTSTLTYIKESPWLTVHSSRKINLQMMKKCHVLSSDQEEEGNLNTRAKALLLGDYQQGDAKDGYL